MAKNKLFLLDAMALLYRAHFAFIKSPRVTKKGMNTSAVFGFTNTLLDIITRENPTHLAVAFDTSAPTVRHTQFEAYKANRQEQPEDLTIAIPYAYKLLKALNIQILVLDGYEADDLIGTLALRMASDAFDVYMVTPDKDYAQLVRDHVFLYKPGYQGGGYEVLGPKEIHEKYGFGPEHMVDFLGLKGDAVDNIPGIPKIGDKTAVSLIQEFGSLENILENVDKVSKKSIQDTLRENADQGRLSKELATILTDVPFECTVDDMLIEQANLDELMPLLNELEFRTLGQRILGSRLNPGGAATPTAAPAGPVQGDLFNQQPEPAPQAPVLQPVFAGYEGDLRTLDQTPHTYTLLETPAGRQVLIEAIRQAGAFCFDTETTALDPLLAEIVAITFSYKATEASMVYFSADQSREEIAAILREFEGILTDPGIEKIGQNLKYDLLVLRRYGIEVSGPMFDTMLAHYVLMPEGKHNMDDMSADLLGYQPVSIETLIGKKGKNQLSMRDVEKEKILDYACEDADVTFQLYEKLAPMVRGNKVFETIDQPLMPVLAKMEWEGITLDKQALADYSVELEQRLVILEKEVYQLAGETFNINSPKQLGEILFDKLKLGKGEKQKKTATGQYVTDEQMLSDLALTHELPDKILAYRGVKKLKSTYVDALPTLIHPETGRVHTTFSQSVAVTGRLASVNPNLQNIPIRTEDGREVRKGFIPRGPGWWLVSADYSQVELRIMAAMSGDVNMIAAFKNGEDIHRASAARVFGVHPDEVTSAQRSAAKTVNFGIIYGISAFGLSQRMGISRSEAADIIENYFKQYAGVKAYMDDAVNRARENGYVETLFGRRRYLPDIHSRNQTVRGFAERNAINSPIQGTAADIIKLAMIAVQREFEARQLTSRMVLQVHDELVFDVVEEELELVKTLAPQLMTSAVSLEVPMEAEVGAGKNWLQAH